MNRKRIPLVGILGISLFALVGCGQPSVTNTLSNFIGVTPPSDQYITTVKKSIGNDAISDFQLDYIKQLTPTLSVCLYTFQENGKLLYNESLVAMQNNQWNIAYSAIASPVYDSGPLTKMDMNGSYGGKIKGNIQVGATSYQIIGGFINDPAISLVELTNLSGGGEMRPLQIVDVGKLRMYAYAQVVPNQRIPGWQINTYDKFGSMISLSNTQLKALGIMGTLPKSSVGKTTTLELHFHPRPIKS